MYRLSIIICTRNRSRSLPALMEPLKAIQTQHAWELLLVDNASTDDTRAVLDAAIAGMHNARVITVTRVGLGAARDEAWRASRGEIVLFTDDDCYVSANIVDAAVNVFESDSEIGFAGGRILLHDPADYPVTIDERDAPEAIKPYRFIEPGALQGANMAFRRSSLERISGIDAMFGAGTLFPCEDIDAVAACAWAGISGRFDPTIIVRHHHGRKADDYPALMASYDRGRGAYYTKYIMRPDSRSAYLRGWARQAFSGLHRGKLETLSREFASARRYLRHRRAWRGLAIAYPAALAFYATLALAVIVNKGRTLLGRHDSVSPTENPA